MRMIVPALAWSKAIRAESEKDACGAQFFFFPFFDTRIAFSPFTPYTQPSTRLVSMDMDIPRSRVQRESIKRQHNRPELLKDRVRQKYANHMKDARRAQINRRRETNASRKRISFIFSGCSYGFCMIVTILGPPRVAGNAANVRASASI